MKRLAFVLSVLLLVGCTQTKQPGPETEKPPVDSKVVIELSAVDKKRTIKPGETAKFPVGTVGITVHFPKAVDWYGIHPKAEPTTWHFEAKNRIPEANLYYFVIRPDEGASLKVTMPLDSVKSADGKPLLSQPLVFYVDTSQGG